MSPTRLIACPHYDLVPKEIGRNLVFRRQLLEEAGNDPHTAAQLRTMCAEDPLFYINAFCWTYDPRPKEGKRAAEKVVPFVTYAFQDETILALIECIETGCDAAIYKSRDVGATWVCCIVPEWLWHFYDNLSFLLVSRNEDYVDKRGNPKSLFWKIDFLHRHQPKWLLPTDRWLGDKDPGRKKLHLRNADNGSVIDGESTTGDAGRGDRRTAMVIDEHASFELSDGFKVLHATRDTTRTRIFNSTPQGANDAFYQVIHKTAARKLRLHWSRHPEKNRGLYCADPDRGELKLLDDFRGEVTVRSREGAEKRVLYPEFYPFELDKNDPKVRSPWYDNECKRCISPQEIAQELDIDFLGSAYPFFEARFIEMLRAKYCRPPLLVGDLEFDPETLEPKRFVENDQGKLWLWLTLDGRGRPAADRQFVLGSDVSAGTGASNSVTSAVDRRTGEKVAVFRDPNVQPNPFGKIAVALARFFNEAYMIWDASGPFGKNFGKQVIAAGYGYIYFRKYEKKITRKVSDEPGYYLNPDAKASLFEDYRAALASHRFVNRSDLGMQECLQFIRLPNGGIEHSAASSSQDPSGARTAHGDEVVADALACHAVFEHSEQPDPEPPTVPYGSLAWRRHLWAETEARQKEDRLGPGWRS